MISAHAVGSKIAGVGTKTFDKEVGLDVDGTIFVPESTHNLVAIGHTLAMKPGSFIKIDVYGLSFFTPDGRWKLYPNRGGLYPIKKSRRNVHIKPQSHNAVGCQSAGEMMESDQDEFVVLDTACSQGGVKTTLQ